MRLFGAACCGGAFEVDVGGIGELGIGEWAGWLEANEMR